MCQDEGGAVRADVNETDEKVNTTMGNFDNMAFSFSLERR